MAQEDVVEQPQDAEEAEPEQVHCRHCGQPVDDVEAGSDFLCPACGRYQDSMMCPTCGGQARISLMPEDLAPPVHAPARRRKAKE